MFYYLKAGAECLPADYMEPNQNIIFWSFCCLLLKWENSDQNYFMINKNNIVAKSSLCYDSAVSYNLILDYVG